MDDIWLYEISGESWGVVKAETRESAKAKVREAYKKHDTQYCANTPIIIKSKEEDGNWFSDAPDVLEVFG